jgi:8-oxo-dGTP pyrophosphatase MutT (NUDIX family)
MNPINNQQPKIIKVGCIVWGIDPQNNPRFLLRHNKPFDNFHKDEWAYCFGTVEANELPRVAAIREVGEEFGITTFSEVIDLQSPIKTNGRRGPRITYFFAFKVDDIELPIKLNEESIGYDWLTLDKAREIISHKDESDLLLKLVNR